MQLGLVLSGGGAKGAAHIGVLKALEEEKINICSISGTSSGSIVASLYACGYTPREIYYIFKKYCKCITDYDNMIPFKVLNTLFTGKIKLKSLAKGNNLENIIYNMCYRKGKVDMSQMNIPCVIPAVDIVDGKIVYFLSRNNRGKIIDTTHYSDEPEYIYGGKISSIVRASSAFPGVFEPKRIGNHLLVDGGTRVNSPVTVLKNIREQGEKIMVIYFEKINNNYEPKNIIDTTIKAFDIMGHEVNEYQINNADYLVDIESKNIGLLEISKIDYMVNLGYKVTKNYIQNNLL
jgi:NTE family protein